MKKTLAEQNDFALITLPGMSDPALKRLVELGLEKTNLANADTVDNLVAGGLSCGSAMMTLAICQLTAAANNLALGMGFDEEGVEQLISDIIDVAHQSIGKHFADDPTFKKMMQDRIRRN